MEDTFFAELVVQRHVTSFHPDFLPPLPGKKKNQKSPLLVRIKTWEGVDEACVLMAQLVFANSKFS